MPIRFDKKLFIALVLSFVGFTSLGTITHEAGHYLMGRYVGFGVSVHYGFTTIDSVPASFKRNDDAVRAIRKKYHEVWLKSERPAPAATSNFPEHDRYASLLRRQQRTLFLINVGCPLQTISTGTIGLALLIINRKRWVTSKQPTSLRWLFIFIALFWLRQSFNLTIALKTILLTGEWPSRMDEMKLAEYLHLWPPTLSLLTGVTGFGVLFYVVFYRISTAQRFTFIIAGLIGGSLGYWLWLVFLGPRLMP